MQISHTLEENLTGSKAKSLLDLLLRSRRAGGRGFRVSLAFGLRLGLALGLPTIGLLRRYRWPGSQSPQSGTSIMEAIMSQIRSTN